MYNSVTVRDVQIRNSLAYSLFTLHYQYWTVMLKNALCSTLYTLLWGTFDVLC